MDDDGDETRQDGVLLLHCAVVNTHRWGNRASEGCDPYGRTAATAVNFPVRAAAAAVSDDDHLSIPAGLGNKIIS